MQVRYTVTTDGTAGIDKMEVQFVFDDITAAELPLTQQFSVTYKTVNYLLYMRCFILLNVIIFMFTASLNRTFWKIMFTITSCLDSFLELSRRNILDWAIFCMS